MKILEMEIALREETRGLQQAKPQLDTEKYRQDAGGLAETQQQLSDRAQAVIDFVLGLDNTEEFEKELDQLKKSRAAMNDAVAILSEPDTGAPAIAAESEAIEWLLMAKRSKGPLTRDGKNMTGSALALLGETDEEKAQVQQRVVQQSTGTSERVVAEEFRYGLDQYFENLEKRK